MSPEMRLKKRTAGYSLADVKTEKIDRNTNFPDDRFHRSVQKEVE